MPEYEWGTASSPIIYNGLVIVQCDTQKDSFLIGARHRAPARRCGRRRGRAAVVGHADRLSSASRRSARELVTNASNFIRGYDPDTGEELWRLGGSSKITAPTPVFADDLIIVASGRAPERPIFAIRPGGQGDITPAGGRDVERAPCAWSKTGRGSYMPTPLIYRGLVYVLANNGLLDAYDLATGREIYRQRLPHQGSGFSASPVAADGRIYLSSEDGDIFVVRAGASSSCWRPTRWASR